TYVATFIGSPTMNLIAGQAAADGQGLVLPEARLPLACPVAASQGLTLGVRPEHLLFSDSAAWRGEVNVVEPTGADTYVMVQTAAGMVTVRTSPQIPVRPGDRVGLEISPGQAHWFDTVSGMRL
ncbi:MAG: TOBE domain-containing protein, partial [Burkholderiales bacterium]|nr:TOBE domain-containing protein [Burkholderiales bacterium]